jgi:hypothetical protein
MISRSGPKKGKVKTRREVLRHYKTKRTQHIYVKPKNSAMAIVL